MGLAKYAEDNDGILEERISGKYDFFGVDPWTNTKVAYKTNQEDGFYKPSYYYSGRR